MHLLVSPVSFFSMLRPDRFLICSIQSNRPAFSLSHVYMIHLFPLSSPSLLPPRCFPPRKAGSSRQPFVTVPYLNCFHGFPFRSIHTVGVLLSSLSLLCCYTLRFTNLNYLEGCFDARITPLLQIAPFSLSLFLSPSLAYFKSRRLELS